jgi:23S rRNA pseudouridine1911/1915/1917 synthase
MTDHRLVIPPDMSGERADRAVAALLDLSRSKVRAIFDSGGVVIGGAPVRASHKMLAGDELEVSYTETINTLEPDADVPFSVLHDDDGFVIVDKPVGVVVHPSSERSRGTLVHGLLARYPEVEGVGQEGRWGIVHRLDRDTSGLLVVARTEVAYEQLSRMMRERDVTRRYLSVVAGLFDATTGTIDAPIARDQANPTRMKIDGSGRSARSSYRRIAGWSNHDASLVSVTLDTGRTHQIRVHMRAIDHPIIGDRAYGRPGTVGDPGRPWLHARQLTFAHPFTGETIDIVSPLPTDLGDSLSTLGEPDSGRLEDIDGRNL